MHALFKNGLAAARENAAPGFLFQCFALTLVLLYYCHAPTRAVLLEIPAFKERAGILFPLLSTAIAGGLIPFLFMMVRKEIAPGKRISNLMFFLGFWAFNGMAVDLLYKAQAQLFGDQPSANIIIKKVCFDQFVYNPLWSVPWAVTALHWKNCGFSFRNAAATLNRRLFFQEFASVLISTWAVWIPAVSIIYSLPLALQFPLFNIVLCFWSLLLTALSKKEES
jgi:hypothetical protein